MSAADHHIRNGEWVELETRGKRAGGYFVRLACCCCGLVHDVDVRVGDGSVQYRPRVNTRDTARLRAEMGAK